MGNSIGPGAVAVIATAAPAAEKAAPAAAPKGPAPAETTYDDPLGRSTPEGTVLGFIRAMQREDYERAVEFLDTKQTGKRARQLAAELHFILDQGVSAAPNPRGTSRTAPWPAGRSWAPSRQRAGSTRSSSSLFRRRTTPPSGSSPRRP
ncbi:MAG: hypothetical protein MUE57_06660 [Syntrophales bacterium]|nr:hypothetical protein [Syntrophales bacterium]